MKAKYYPEDDIMVLELSERAYDYAEKVGSFIIHYTKNKKPVMIEILNASQFIKDTTGALPYRTLNKILHLQPA